MKKVYNIFNILLLSLLTAVSCTKEAEPVYTGKAVPAQLQAFSSSEAVLEKDHAADIFQTFSWTKADYGLSLAVSYTLEMALAGTDFAQPVSLTTTTQTSFSITVKDMNTALKRMGCPENEASAIAFRVQNTVSPSIVSVYSNVNEMTITPYSDIIVYPALNLPGDYQGWDPANMNTVIYSVNADDKYDGYVYFSQSTAEFKFAKGSWDVNWGDDGTNTGKLKSGGDNFKVSGAGLYHLSCNLNELTYTIEAVSWGIVGDAIGSWDNDWVMEYDADLNALRYYGHFLPGEFKFRANKGWALNLGASGIPEPAGALSYGGDNITNPKEGDFTLLLRLNQAIYTYKFYSGTVIADWPYLNIPGGHQGWDPSNMTTVIWSAKSNDFYEGYLWFAEANNEFKFAYNSWTTNWGDDGSGKKLKPDGDNLKATEAGLYRLQADLNDLSYSFVFTNWGIVGSATAGGWDTDTPMTYSTETGLLTITADLTEGEFKFRANNNWDYNYGKTDTEGVLSAGGDNIPVTAGNYTITLDLSQKKTPGYRYTMQKN